MKSLMRSSWNNQILMRKRLKNHVKTKISWDSHEIWWKAHENLMRIFAFFSFLMRISWDSHENLQNLTRIFVRGAMSRVHQNQGKEARSEVEGNGEVAALLRDEGISITKSQCNNEWKSMVATLKRWKTKTSRLETTPGSCSGPFHDELGEILSERASTRPSIRSGTAILVVCIPLNGGVDNDLGLLLSTLQVVMFLASWCHVR